jgi:hypothetical protein
VDVVEVPSSCDPCHQRIRKQFFIAVASIISQVVIIGTFQKFAGFRVCTGADVPIQS